MAEAVPQPAPPQNPQAGMKPSGVPTPEMIWQMAQNFLDDPKQLLMFGQAMQNLVRVGGALQPPPDPAQMMSQPGPMEQLAMMDLQRRQQEWQQIQAQRQQAGMPVPAQ